jgi:hypothetical protein
LPSNIRVRLDVIVEALIDAGRLLEAHRYDRDQIRLALES